jgi:hypothetical protein
MERQSSGLAEVAHPPRTHNGNKPSVVRQRPDPLRTTFNITCNRKDTEMAKRASIHDVASAAAVSVSTVSNVLNRPSVVAAHTRERVRVIIGELGYERDENAASLRLGKKVIRRQRPRALPHCDPFPKAMPADGTRDGPAAGRASTLMNQDWRDFALSRAIHVASHGQEVGGGIIEACMPDGSGAWVRFDDGRGRLLLMQEDGYSFTEVQESGFEKHGL